MNDESMGLSLAKLIRRHQDHTGETYTEIATRAGLSKAKVGQLALPGSRQQLRPETMEKLAVGLRLSPAIVRRAAMVTAGVADADTARDARIELIVSQLELLDEKTLEMVAAMVDAAARQAGG